MNKKNLQKFVLLIAMFSFCSFFKEPKYCKLSDRIFIPYNKELKKQKHLYLIGSGGAMVDDIQKVNAPYASFEKMNIEEVRRLYVDVAEGYLCRYNQNEEIRPYLHDYPFTIDNLDITIGFRNEQYTHRDGGFIALVFIGKKQHLVYCIYDREINKFVDLHKEPYETARDIVLREREYAQRANPIIDKVE